MDTKKIRNIIQEELKDILENQPATQPKPGVVEPGTKPEPKPKRRTLAPPTESPNTKPKAQSKNIDEDNEIIKKIADRYKKIA